MEETDQPKSKEMNWLILTRKCSVYRNTGFKVFCSQTVVNAMNGGREETVDNHPPLFIYLFPLDKTVSYRKYQGRQNRTPVLLISLLMSLSLLKSLLEKQAKANFNQGPQKIYCNHQGSYVRKKEGGGNFPDSILRYGSLV